MKKSFSFLMSCAIAMSGLTCSAAVADYDGEEVTTYYINCNHGASKTEES